MSSLSLALDLDHMGMGMGRRKHTYAYVPTTIYSYLLSSTQRIPRVEYRIKSDNPTEME